MRKAGVSNFVQAFIVLIVFLFMGTMFTCSTATADEDVYFGEDGYVLEGSWKSVGSYGFGQAQPGAPVYFDGVHCNFLSPYDTYEYYEENGEIILSCKSCFFGEVLKFKVRFLDEEHVNIIWNVKYVTELTRTGWLVTELDYDPEYTEETLTERNTESRTEARTESRTEAITEADDRTEMLTTEKKTEEEKTEEEAEAYKLYEIKYTNDYDEGIAKVYWTPDLFSDSSEYTYNNELAKTAAALNAAASDYSGKTGSGQFIGNAFLNLGFEKSRISLFSYPDNKQGLNEKKLSWANDKDFAFSIASMDFKDFTVIAVIIRGTETAMEGGLDGFAGALQDKFYSTGYYSFSPFLAFEADVYNGLNYYIEKHKKELQNKNVKMLISGHSLGGATANLFAAHMNNHPVLGMKRKDIFAFTFGALNSLTEECSGKNYSNIWNIFNFYDTFGPWGEGSEILGIKPTHGADTIYNKFGNVIPFKNNYKRVFVKGDDRYKNHVMACYYNALNDQYVKVNPGKKTREYYRAVLSCPIDVQVLDEDGNVVVQIINDEVDEEHTSLPAYVSGPEEDAVKNILIPNDGKKYYIRVIGTDTGTMDYYVEPFGEKSDDIVMTQDIVEYEKVEVQPKSVILGVVSEDSIGKQELVDAEGNPVKAEYTTVRESNDEGFKYWWLILAIPSAFFILIIIPKTIVSDHKKKKKARESRAKTVKGK